MKILVIIGTRPEAIKIAPLVLALRERPEVARVRIALSGQHARMLDGILGEFGLAEDFDLKLMQPAQSSLDFLTRVLPAVRKLLERGERPDLVVVQGDTTTAFAAGLASFYLGIPVAHLEAGLRTGDHFQPFPEEAHRSMLARLATFHFAPTKLARSNLVAEGIPLEKITVTGNTGIDAIRHFLRGKTTARSERPRTFGRYLLVTIHRRENFGAPLREICAALECLVTAFEDLSIIFPVHLNPAVHEVVHASLASKPRIHLSAPLGYREFCSLIAGATVLISDSGGIQEEATYLGKPILVPRRTTERQEALQAGAGQLVDPTRERLFAACARLLTDAGEYQRRSIPSDIFGDGYASERIADVILKGHHRAQRHHEAAAEIS